MMEHNLPEMWYNYLFFMFNLGKSAMEELAMN